jgi:hypothetical protein
VNKTPVYKIDQAGKSGFWDGAAFFVASTRVSFALAAQPPMIFASLLALRQSR